MVPHHHHPGSDLQCASSGIAVNTPAASWWRGSAGGNNSTTPGGTLRIVGRNLAFAQHHCASVLSPLQGAEAAARNVAATLVPATPAGRNVSLTIVNATCYDMLASVPPSAQPGAYHLHLHNGLAPASASRDGGPLRITIIPAPAPWPSRVFPVDPKNVTASLAEAQAGALANGGGVIYFPRGRYELSLDSTLNAIPPHTVVTGESRSLVSLVWMDPAPTSSSSAPLVTGPAGHWVLTNLTLYVAGRFGDIVSDGAQDGVRVLNIRLRANPNYALMANTTAPFRNRSLPCGLFGTLGDAFRFQGAGFELADSDIYHGGEHLLNLDRSLNPATGVLVGARDGHIHHNTFYYGVRAYHMESTQRIIFEHNTITGISLTSMGNDVVVFYGVASEKLLFARNTERLMFGADHEMMTLDGGGGMFWGSLASYTTSAGAATAVLGGDPQYHDYSPDMPHQAATAFFGLLEGTGAGLYTRVAHSDNRTLTLTRPLARAPDTTSRVSVVPFRGDYVFAGNRFEDGGPFQLYAMSIDIVVAENWGARMTGFSSWGRNPHGWGWQPSWRCQFLNNTIAEGNAWGTATASFASVTSDEQPGNFTGPLNRGLVYRNNAALGNAGFVFTGTLTDAVVEHNVVEAVDTPLVLDPAVNTGVFFRGNAGF